LNLILVYSGAATWVFLATPLKTLFTIHEQLEAHFKEIAKKKKKKKFKFKIETFPPKRKNRKKICFFELKPQKKCRFPGFTHRKVTKTNKQQTHGRKKKNSRTSQCKRTHDEFFLSLGIEFSLKNMRERESESDGEMNCVGFCLFFFVVVFYVICVIFKFSLRTTFFLL